MLGENCTRLAVKLLANIALGRGAQLAVDTVRGGKTKFIIHSTLSCLAVCKAAQLIQIKMVLHMAVGLLCCTGFL